MTNIARTTTWAGHPAWLVTDYQTVRELLADPRLGLTHQDPEHAPRLSASVVFGQAQQPSPTDDEDHERMRRLLAQRFSARRLAAFRPRVQEFADLVLDNLAAQDQPADFHEHVSFPLPAMVICEMLGVPPERREEFRRWSDDAAALHDRDRSLRGQSELAEYISCLIAERMSEPRDDLLSDLVAAHRADPGGFTLDKVQGLGTTLLFAGHETTVTAIDVGVTALASHPDQMEELARHPEGLTDAVEEILRGSVPRMWSFVVPADTDPNGAIPRWANTDLDIAGVTIRTGEMVLLGLWHANVDKDLVGGNAGFDITRHPNSHVTFGHGPHFCAGAPLARLELQVLFGSVVRRFPRLRLAIPASQLRGRDTVLTGGFTRVPVVWLRMGAAAAGAGEGKISDMRLECAIRACADTRTHARTLSRIWEDAQTGRSAQGEPRPLIAESWERVRRAGVDPDYGREVTIHDRGEIERRRHESGLSQVVEVLRSGLVSFADDGTHIMVITDAEGCVLWEEGHLAVRPQAGALGFVEGAQWDENTVGTNAIGTVLVEQRPLQVFAAEHYVRTHHPWVCAAAPLRDPRNGHLLGVIDISGPAATAHPSTVALVASVAKLAEASLRVSCLAALEQLRSAAAPVLAKIHGPALVTDRDGRVAAASGILPPDRVLLPDPPQAGPAYVAPFGLCQVEPLFNGWLIRVDDGEFGTGTVVQLNLGSPVPSLVVAAPSGVWQHRLSPRHAEILHLLAQRPAGYSAAELSARIYGDSGHTIAIRAEMSRLRQRLGSLLAQRPYRFQPWLEVICDFSADGVMPPARAASG